MHVSRRDFLKMTGFTAGALSLGSSWSPNTTRAAFSDDPALHLLNRLTWGATSQDLDYINTIGLSAFLEEQLNPETIDDSAMAARLAELPILNMTRQEARRLVSPEYRTYVALTKGMVQRAVHSRRQLLERMVEFWTDHFNMPDDELGAELIPYHRDVVRKHALGNFRDLLFGTAQSPAMLYYLDNYLSDAEHPNENYARELLELHTLGVDGGYTEIDVKEVARALTGWTIRDGTESGFYFDPNMHDDGEKQVLGHTLPAGRGIEDGLQVLSIVSNHPATARYLCFKLCRRFVSDDPPATLVESAAVVWQETAGDIKAVLRHLFAGNEFWQSVGQKLRRPLDFFIAALRVTPT